MPRIPRSFALSRVLGEKPSAIVADLLYWLGVCVAPLLIGATSLYALLAWDNSYRDGPVSHLPFRLYASDTDLSPGPALAALAAEAPRAQFDTRLSQRQFWFSFQLAPEAPNATTIEFPDRHIVSLLCWDSATMAPLGAISPDAASGALRRAKSGVSLDLGSTGALSSVACAVHFLGPAHMTIEQWTTPGFAASERRFQRDSGLLDGGIGVLAVFVFLTALINRQWLYVIFAAWLIANLRLAANSAGWDVQWLDRNIPWDILPEVRMGTTVLYYFLTVALFGRLFRDDLKRVGYGRLVGVLQLSCFVLLAAVVLLPLQRFLPVLWTCTVFTVCVVVFLLARIVRVTQSRVAIWWAVSLIVTLGATLYEVVAAVLGMHALSGTVNFVTAALSSCLIAALAIAEGMRQEHAGRVAAQSELLQSYDAIPIGLFTLNLQGTFTRVNAALRSKLVMGSETPGHFSEYFALGAWARLESGVLSHTRAEVELRGRERTGAEPRWFLARATLAFDKIEGSLQDITERVVVGERMRFLADHDPLTGIYNRRGIEALFDVACQRRAGEVAVAHLDLDRFKLINDLYGHAAGDEILRQVCERIARALPSGQDLGRLGGDEFLIVLQGMPFEAATRLCNELVLLIGTAPYLLEDRAFQVKCSIGLLEVGAHLSTADAIPLADRACREAKKRRCGLVVYDRAVPALREGADVLRLAQRIGANATPEGLFLLMQPIMSLHAPYDSLDFEALLRMHEPDGSITAAGGIVGAAEADGHISIIDRWVLSNVLEWLYTHLSHLKNTRFVCVNLSGGSLNDENFVKDVFSMLADAGPAAERLCIEITESVALHDLENTRRFIEKVRSYGTKIALDDFGAGYTSFSYLRELPADAVKIDGTFVRGVNTHPANLAIVTAIVELARNLGMKSIAEWVEDRATLESLAAAGADYVQGYAIGGPIDPESMLLRSSSADGIEDLETERFVRNILGNRPDPEGTGQDRLERIVGV